MDKVNSLIEDANGLYESDDLHAAISKLEHAWEELPEPKFSQQESYHIAHYCIKLLIEISQSGRAEDWADLIQFCAPDRIDDGEREFLKATVKYELGDFREAKELLRVANTKSDGSCFEDEDPKYKKLLLGDNHYPHIGVD